MFAASHPSRGAWIEMFHAHGSPSHHQRRTPHGVRGLKYALLLALRGVGLSHPSRGAWIEIP